MEARAPKTPDMRLGPFEWRPSPQQAADFAVATKTAKNWQGPAPLTFAIRILALPEFRGALAELIGQDRAAVHESQNFCFFSPLEPGASYFVSALGRQESDPLRLIIDWTICAGQKPIMEARTILRLFELCRFDPNAMGGQPP